MQIHVLNWGPLSWFALMQSDVKTKKAFSIFWATTQKEETAEKSTANDEAEPENDQLSEPKLKLPKQNFQKNWLEKYKWLKLPKQNFQKNWLEKYKWLKFDPPKGMFCLLGQKWNLKSISREKIYFTFLLDNDHMFNSVLNIALVGSIAPAILE